MTDIEKKREQWRRAGRKYYWRHKERRKEYGKKWYFENRKSILQRQHLYRFANINEAKLKEERRKSKLYYHQHRDIVNAKNKQRALNVKLEVLTHYGNGKCVCVRCGYDDIRALSIDHTDGGGTQHRNSVAAHGNSFYRYLRKLEYPKGYQVLCMNCQFVKRVEENELGRKR